MNLLQAAQIVGAILATIVVVGGLVLVHEIGHFVTARVAGIRVLEFGIGFPPRAKVLGRRGETTYTLNWLPIGGFVKVEGEDSESPDPAAFSNAPLRKQLVFLAAGVAVNLVAAVVLFYFAAWLFNPTAGFRIEGVRPNMPAAAAGLQTGQTIESVNGHRYGYLTGEDAAAELRRNAGHEVQLGIVNADGSRQTVTVTLADQQTIDQGRGALGVDLLEVPLGGFVTGDPFAAAPAAVDQTGRALGGILAGLGRLGEGILSHPTEAPSGIGGPIEITRQVGVALWDYGPGSIVIMAAVLSANLALVNILPFPPLDGGRMAVLVVKRLFGRRGVSRLEATSYLVGFTLLLAFVVWISFFDITQPGRP